MNTALDHFRPVRLPALIELLGSDIACSLRFADRDKPSDAGRTCELLLANKAAVAVSVRLFGVDRRARTKTFGELSVASNGLGRSVFVLPNGASACERVYVEVVGDGIRLCADARVIAKRKAPVFSRVATLTGIVAFGTAAIIMAVGFAYPVITAFGLPRTAPPGPVTAMYETGGAANASFTATMANGLAIGHGGLTARNGSFSFVVPPAAAGHDVTVALDLSGPLGRAHREVTFAVETAAAPAAAAPSRSTPIHASLPRIAYFTAHRDDYEGRATILASYQASGERGELRIRDEHGAVIGSRRFSHVGTTRLTLPKDVAGQSLRAEIDVWAGGSRSTAAVEVPAQPAAKGSSDAAGVALDAPAVAAGADDAGSQPMPGDPFAVAQRVVAGRPFSIAIRHALPELRIALQTTTGTIIDEVAVPAGARQVSLAAPASSAVEIYYLAGTFTRASAEETLVRSVRVFPH